MQMLLALMAAIACVLLGIMAANRLQGREKLLQAWETALQQMAWAAAHHPLPLPALLRLGADNHLAVLETLADMLEASPALSLNDFLSHLPSNPLLTPPEESAIREGLTGLFSPIPEIQIQSLSGARDQLAHFHQISREAAEKNSRLYNSLGFLAGAALFILLC